jgi:hypothetical protein
MQLKRETHPTRNQIVCCARTTFQALPLSPCRCHLALGCLDHLSTVTDLTQLSKTAAGCVESCFVLLYIVAMAGVKLHGAVGVS